MANATSDISVKDMKILDQACSRNAAADLHIEHPGQGIVTARVRLLEIDDGQIHMNRPQSIGTPLQLSSDQPVKVYFLLSGTRYAFHTTVTRPACYVRLNASQKVLGVAVALPEKVSIEQRRSDFRVSLAAQESVSVLIHAGTEAEGGACPIATPRMVGRLVNVSAGGMGVQCNAKQARAWPRDCPYFLSFELPGTDAALVMMAELRHVRPLSENIVAIAGFKFLPWSTVPLKQSAHTISRFIATNQRRNLRRAR